MSYKVIIEFEDKETAMEALDAANEVAQQVGQILDMEYEYPTETADSVSIKVFRSEFPQANTTEDLLN